MIHVIGFVGCGKMATALIASMLSESGLKPNELIAFDVNPVALKRAVERFSINAGKSNLEVVEKSHVVFLAVKPQDLGAVFREVSLSAMGKLFVSIAAGVSLEELRRGLPGARIIRVMPNIACLVRETMACYCAASSATAKDKEFVEAVFSRAGKVLGIGEEKMHAVTVLSGSGPGFIAFFLGELANAAVKHGLSEREAELLARQMLLGTAKLLSEKRLSFDELVSMVASPKGTTEAGLLVFEENRFRRVVEAAFKAAVERSVELGK